MAEKKYIGKPGKQDDPCWKGYEMVGMKKKGGRQVPNCVPEATDIIAKAKAAVAKKAGAKLKLDPDTGTPDHFTAAQRRKKGLDESIDKNHPIVKEYNALKKHDIKTLRGMIAQSGGVVDTSGFKSKDHAASHIIRSKHGNKKVDVAFGFNEDTSADREVGTKSLTKKYQKETPGQEKADINEIFNTTFDEDIERRSDFRMVKVRTPTGFVWRKTRKEADVERDAE